jgi:type II secretory ATPase GspE/PulE/Tfp pilus assembly ATPase PilB-like protein
MNKVAFEWPTPPYFHFDHDNSPNKPETCLIYLRNGSKILGDLIQHLPEESSIVFLPTRSEINETIPLNEIKSMRLVEPLLLKKHQTSLESRAEEFFPASERQKYTVEYLDKQIIKAETIGFTSTTIGLYLYLPAADEKIVRCFIPHQVIANYQIGSKIGEILINENLASREDIDNALSHQHELRTQRIGDYFSEHQIISIEQLDEAIKYQESQPILKLGEALLQLGLITETQLSEALLKQKENRNVQLGQILIKMNVIDEPTLKGVLARKMGIPYVALSKFNFDMSAVNLIDASLARKHMLMPLCLHDTTLIVALENPLDIKALESLRFITQKKIIPAMASAEDILLAINKFYDKPKYFDNPDFGASSDFASSRNAEGDFIFSQDDSASLKTETPAEKPIIVGAQLDLPKGNITESDASLIKLINKMIMDAHENGASDIHIESYAGKQNTQVRFRKYGKLTPYFEIPPNARNAMISRIKTMAQLDVAEHRKPQNGKINFQNFGSAKVELRVTTIPIDNNLEDIVMRLLLPSMPLPIEDLGLTTTILNDLQRLIQGSSGLILVCGPAASGKTTTLHALLGYINTPERKILTAEDPVEITQAGLRQVQINTNVGWTFASAMRTFLRADPDVIMLGEMCDAETTKIAIEASLTGHLVLSTLHTNSAAESIAKLLNLGMDPFSIADALQAVLAQRLAKSLCPKCKQEYDAESSEIDDLINEYTVGTKLEPAVLLKEWKAEYVNENKFKLYRAVGCNYCNNTGYRSCIGMHELMIVTPTIKHLIQTRSVVSELLDAAQEAGMKTLKQDGITKVLKGYTDIGQVRAVSV